MTARGVALAVLLSLVLVACDGFSSLPPADPAAERAWQAYRAEPTNTGYMAFILANGKAASRNGEHNDAIGIRYQVRALEIQAWQAERVKDPELAVLVTGRVDELDAGDWLDIYEEKVAGSRARFVAARARAAAVLDQN